MSETERASQDAKPGPYSRELVYPFTLASYVVGPWNLAAKANLGDCLLKSRYCVLYWLDPEAGPVMLGHWFSAHPELVSPKAPVWSTEMEASGWFVLTTDTAMLSGGLLGRKGRGTRQGRATVVDVFRSYNLDVLVKSPDCSLRHIEGMDCVSILLLLVIRRCLELLG